MVRLGSAWICHDIAAEIAISLILGLDYEGVTSDPHFLQNFVPRTYKSSRTSPSLDYTYLEISASPRLISAEDTHVSE